MPALVQFVEQAIVPRLLRGHDTQAARNCRAHVPRAVEKAEVVFFAGLLATADAATLRVYVDDICAQHECIDSIYLDLIVPAARELGTAREEDRYASSDLTIGGLRLAQLVRELGTRLGDWPESARTGRRVLIIPEHGVHACGVYLVGDFFARAGWDVATSTSLHAEAVRIVHDEWFDIIGVSVASMSRPEDVSGEIRRLRAASSNRSAGIMVAGADFVAHPEYVAMVGADTMAADGLEAPFEAERLLGQRARE